MTLAITAPAAVILRWTSLEMVVLRYLKYCTSSNCTLFTRVSLPRPEFDLSIVLILNSTLYKKPGEGDTIPNYL